MHGLVLLDTKKNFATASLLDHLYRNGLESEKETLNIDREYLFVSLRSDFKERTQVKEARIVDQNIDAAGNVDHTLDHAFDGIRAGHVDLNAESALTDRFGCSLCLIQVEIGDCNLAPSTP